MGEHTTEAESLERVAQYTANYLSTIFSSNMILGIAWGTTTSAISRNLVPKTTHHSQIVQLNGAGNTESLGIEYASEILMRFAQNFRATYHLFPVPAFFDRVETKKSLWEETSIKRILELQTRADIWLYSIGSVSAGIPSHLHADGYLKKADYSDLKRLDIAGDIATVFFREDGSYHNILINQRSSGPSLELLKHKRGICVISGQAKLKGLMAAIRGKLLSELILDEPTARVLVENYLGE
jgi:DNA-binding transcriptional regulator LsrR (DeoR family)